MVARDSVDDPRLLPRERLVDRVRSTPPGGLLVLDADPGYGRRTLLRQALGSDVVMVVVDHGDAVPVRERVLEALGVPGVDDVLQAWSRSGAAWLAVVGHEGHGDLLAEVAELARRCPTDRRLAVAVPGGARARGARRDGSVVIDQDELALTRDEVQQLLDRLAPSADERTRRQLVELCDGWAEAVITATARLATHPHRDVLPWLRTHGSEQLLGPWLDARSARVRDMLLDTALLDRLEPSLVDAVTGRGDGDLLASLARPRGPVRVVVGEDGEVRFDRHPLLTTLLRFQAAGRAGDLERRHRAAVWYRAHGDLGRELTHLLAAGDAVAAAERLHEVESELMATGRADEALHWYESLGTRPTAEHLLRQAWALGLSGQVQESRLALAQLRAVLVTHEQMDPFPHPPVGDMEAEADVVDAWQSEQVGDVLRTLRTADRARLVFGRAWTTNSMQLAALLSARAQLLLGDVRAASDLLESIRENPYGTASLGEGRRAETEAEVAWAAGHVHRARTWAARHDRWLRLQEHGTAEFRQRSVIGLLCAAEDGRSEEARDGLLANIRLSRPGGSTTELALALLALATVEAASWDLRAALDRCRTAREVILSASPDGGLIPLVSGLQARVRLMAGDHVRAERLLRTLPASLERRLLEARTALVRGHSAAALLRRIEPTTPRTQVETDLLLAWSLVDQSTQRSEQLLLRAADIAAQHGLTTSLTSFPEHLVARAHRVGVRQVHDPLVHLVVVAEQSRGRHELPTDDTALSRGDLELLALLPTRATYGRIAAELGVSVNTVKTRLRRLYAKLDVHDRDAAIARATQLGLLGDRRRP